MNVRSVDPRDMGREIDPLAYRVHFWEAKNFSHDGIESTSWTSDEYEMTETSDLRR